MRTTIVTFVCILFKTLTCAQNPSPLSGSDALTAIQKGFVIVRLHVNNQKKEYLAEQLSESNSTQRGYLEKQYKEYVFNRETYVKKMMYAFNHWFDLCPVYFYYDFDQKKIVDGVLPKGIFLDEEGKHDPKILPLGNNYLVIARKESDQSITAASGLKVMDPSGNVVPPPFPQPKTPSFISIWFKSSNPKAKKDEYYDKELESMITKWVDNIKNIKS